LIIKNKSKNKVRKRIAEKCGGNYLDPLGVYQWHSETF